ncbi:MAG: hypothetical protein AAFO58_00315 [Pseudomonadota bacterium]
MTSLTRHRGTLTRAGAILALITLAGCVAPSGPAVTPDIRASDRPVARLDTVELRTFVQRGLGRTELAGLTCRVSGPTFQAAVTTPGRLRVPVYRGASPDLDVVCTRPLPTGGSQTAVTVIEATNTTAEAADEGLRVSVGSSGTAVRLGVSIRDRSQDRFDYPARIRVDFPG